MRRGSRLPTAVHRDATSRGPWGATDDVRRRCTKSRRRRTQRASSGTHLHPEDVSRRTRVERAMLPLSAATSNWPNLEPMCDQRAWASRRRRRLDPVCAAGHAPGTHLHRRDVSGRMGAGREMLPGVGGGRVVVRGARLLPANPSSAHRRRRP